MLYFADDTKETKLAKIDSAIKNVKGTLKNKMEKWERKEYEGVLEEYEAELKAVKSTR